MSVITIFLDGARFLGEAIESVRAQTHRGWELLLVDDGSTDGSSEIAARYAADDPGRIRYLRHESHANRGMSASRNLGLAHAHGEFVAFLDGDDMWLPEKLERQLAIMAAHPEADMTCGSTRLWHGWTGDPEDMKRDAVREIRPGKDALHRPPELLRWFLQDRALTPATCSVLVRRAALARTGAFEERFTGLYEDQAFFIKAYLKLSCFVSHATSDLYRQHADSHSAVALRSGRYFMDRPSPALADFMAWCVRYFVRERVTDPILWTSLVRKLGAIGLNRAMNTLNRPAKRIIATWYGLLGLRYRRQRGGG